ncbi:MAG: rRNA maturation RNase YbeY [Thermodesulfobacteriota bacterium]
MILIKNQQKKIEISESRIRKTARKILKDLGCPDCEISILMVDDMWIEKINKHYLSRSGPTNVISFPMAEGDFAGINPHVLGDVVISVETAKRQAEESEISMEEMLDFFLIHGILHLLGYDHEGSVAEAQVMRAKEKELFANTIKH